MYFKKNPFHQPVKETEVLLKEYEKELEEMMKEEKEEGCVKWYQMRKMM